MYDRPNKAIYSAERERDKARADAERLRLAITIDPWRLGWTGWKVQVDEAIRAEAEGGE